jgi:2-haloacid dehalogenase
MILGRRKFLATATAAAIAGSLPLAARSVMHPRFKAVAFDAFPILDPRPVFALAEKLFPGHGAELSNAWRGRQFEYQWLRALSAQYADFWHVTEDALVFAAKQLQLPLSADQRTQLMQAYLELKAWPEVAPALHALKDAGVRLAFLSNMTARMLQAGIKNSGLEGIFEYVLSTDRIKTYKPDPRAYRMALDAFRLDRGEILFASFAGWDTAGAKAFGYPTFWVNRLNAPAEELGAFADASGHDLAELATFVTAPR